MAGIKAPIQDILNRIKNSGGSINYARVFNNQFQDEATGDIETFPDKCAFVEVLNPQNHNNIGVGITAADITFRIHIGMVEYDATDGTMEQNLTIFDLRDEIKTLLSNYEPTACSMLMFSGEQQDYNHTNRYVYLVDFVCHFIDDKGDQRQGQITKQPPTTLTVEAEFVDELTT